MAHRFKIVESQGKNGRSIFRIMILKTILWGRYRYYTELKFWAHSFRVNDTYILGNVKRRCNSLLQAESLIVQYKEFEKIKPIFYRGYSFLPVFNNSGNDDFELTSYCPKMHIHTDRYTNWYMTFSSYEEFKKIVDKKIDVNKELSHHFID